MKNIILAHAKRYPAMESRDFIKLIYQSEFGGSHFVADEKEALAHLKEEIAALPENNPYDKLFFEPVGCGMERLYLSKKLFSEISPETVNRMAVLSANAKRGSMMHFKQKVEVLNRLIDEGHEEISVKAEDFRSFLAEYEEAGYPSVHHGETYREAYHPAYRLVTDRFREAFDVIRLIEKLRRSHSKKIVIAIDGPAASGKTSLASLLSALYDCNIFHMDDFFLPSELRTEERMDEIGGNVDYLRFRKEVGTKLRHNSPFFYRRYNCHTDSMREIVYVTSKRLNIVEGSYAMHPMLRDLYQGTVFVSVSAETQGKRIHNRNTPYTVTRFFEEWIPMENRYFDTFSVKKSADVVYTTDNIKNNRNK